MPTLHPPAADAGVGSATIFCPFSGDAGTASAVSCARDEEHCCEPTTGTSTCQPLNVACSFGDAGTGTGTDWQCEDPGDCPTGTVCCANGALGEQTEGGMVCVGDYSAPAMTLATCATSCSTIIVCNASGECPAGKTCTPFRHAGVEVGGCL